MLRILAANATTSQAQTIAYVPKLSALLSVLSLDGNDAVLRRVHSACFTRMPPAIPPTPYRPVPVAACPPIKAYALPLCVVAKAVSRTLCVELSTWRCLRDAQRHSVRGGYGEQRKVAELRFENNRGGVAVGRVAKGRARGFIRVAFAITFQFSHLQ